MTAQAAPASDQESELVRKVLDLLSASGADYQVLHHEPVFTSEQAASVRGTPLEDGAKALVCHADDQIVLIVVPANLRLDTRAFKSAYAVKNLRMATAAEVEALGAVVGGCSTVRSDDGLGDIRGRGDRRSDNVVVQCRQPDDVRHRRCSGLPADRAAARRSLRRVMPHTR